MAESSCVSMRDARLTIGIVGFGNFGQFLGKSFSKQGHRIIGLSRGDYTKQAAAIGCEYVRDADVLMDAEPDVVIFCTSIMSLGSVLAKFPLARLEGTLVADVLSVKMYPHNLLVKLLPASADIVCTHPMFGPESGRHSWEGLPFVYDVVRLHPDKEWRCDAFVKLWSQEKCKMVQMSSEEHDTYAASTQFITHTTGRMLNQLNVRSTPINTKGYESLLGVVDTTCKDSFDLFYGLYKYNPNARLELEKLEIGLRNIRQSLDKVEMEEALEAEKVQLQGGRKHSRSVSEEVLESLVRACAK